MEKRLMPTAQPSRLSIDFSNVEERRGGKAAHVPEGDYLLKVVDYEIKTKQGESSKYISWRSEIVEPSKYKTAGSIWHVTSLKPENLWSLRNFLEDLGITVPKSMVDVPLAAIKKKQLVFGATLEDDTYEKDSGGTTKTIVKSKIAATFKKDAFETSAVADTAEDADEEESDEEESEVDELDVDDL